MRTRLLTAAVTLALVYLSHRLLQPAPIPLLTGVAGALLLLLRRTWPRPAVVTLATLLGAAIGVYPHLSSHLEGRSTEPVEGLPAHLAIDGALGFALALTIVGVTFWVARRIAAGRSVR